MFLTVERRRLNRITKTLLKFHLEIYPHPYRGTWLKVKRETHKISLQLKIGQSNAPFNQMTFWP